MWELTLFKCLPVLEERQKIVHQISSSLLVCHVVWANQIGLDICELIN
jgi:hypothetical protein